MGVSEVGRSGDMAATRKEMMQSVFKKLDSDGNGSISKDEMQKAIDAIHDRRAAAGKDAPANAPSVDDLFKSADVNGDGGISQDELLTQMSMAGPPRGGSHGPHGARPGGGPPPGEGSPPAGAANQAGSSSSSSKLSADPADADGDGQVSASERRSYAYKQMMAALSSALKDAGGTGDGSTSTMKSADSVSVVM